MATTTYATIKDIQDRLKLTMSPDEERVCNSLLEDAAVIIDNFNANASKAAKKAVSCRMVIRALNIGSDIDVPVGASQGSMSALGYAQSWTMASGGSTNELYISKQEKVLLGKGGNSIGTYSPIQELIADEEEA